MANIRQRIELVESSLSTIAAGGVPADEIGDSLDALDYEMRIVEGVLSRGGDVEAPLCCYDVEDGKIGCGRYVQGEYVRDIMAPLEKFVKYCIGCRERVSNSMRYAREEAAIARSICDASLEELLDDMDRFHVAQQEGEHLLVPLTTNEELDKHAKDIAAVAKGLAYYHGDYNQELKEAYFAPGVSHHAGLGVVSISTDCIGEPWLYSALSHEITHVLGGFFGVESPVMILGLETDAAMALAGDASHKVAILQVMKNMASMTAYVKAMQSGEIPVWRERIGKLFPESVAADIERLYQEETARDLRTFIDYGAVPYLGLKEAQGCVTSRLVCERDIPIPALTKVLEDFR